LYPFLETLQKNRLPWFFQLLNAALIPWFITLFVLSLKAVMNSGFLPNLHHLTLTLLSLLFVRSSVITLSPQKNQWKYSRPLEPVGIRFQGDCCFCISGHRKFSAVLQMLDSFSSQPHPTLTKTSSILTHLKFSLYYFKKAFTFILVLGHHLVFGRYIFTKFWSGKQQVSQGLKHNCPRYGTDLQLLHINWSA
jgi:hypothetical protein